MANDMTNIFSTRINSAALLVITIKKVLFKQNMSNHNDKLLLPICKKNETEKLIHQNHKAVLNDWSKPWSYPNESLTSSHKPFLQKQCAAVVI